MTEQHEDAPPPPKASRLARTNRAKGASKDEPESKKKLPKGKDQVGIYLDTEFRQRVRTAVKASAYFEGTGSLSDLIERLLEKEVQRLEKKYNGGEPFKPDTKNLPSGPRG